MIPSTVYAISEHDNPDMRWPLEATDWFWQTGDRWMAVYAPFHEDWWEGADPEDIAACPDPGRLPISQVPTSGTLIYRKADGSEVTEAAGAAAGATSPLSSDERELFELLMEMASGDDLALVRSSLKSTGEPVALVCAVYRDGEMVNVKPLARLITGDGIDLFTDPADA